MSNRMTKANRPTCPEECKAAFEEAMPRIGRHAEIQFRNVRCPGRKEELIAEALALLWKWWLDLWDRGKDPREFVSALVTFAVKAARSGRRVAGMDRAKDVLSPRAQQAHGFTVGRLPGFSTLGGNPLAEALAENTVTPVDEQVAFLFDFAAWLATWDARRRDMIEAMARGERTTDLAAAFGVSPARVSHLRAELHFSWEAFVGEAF